MTSVDEILERLKRVDTAKIFFTDLNGRPMSMPVNPENLSGIIGTGIGFDGSSIAGLTTVDDSDRLLMPVPETFRTLEFQDEVLGFFVGKIYKQEGTRSRSDPRAVLERIVEKAETEHRCRFLVGPEHEYFLLKRDEFSEDVHSDKAGYLHADPHDKGEVVRKKVIDVLKGCGIRFEKAHHEVTPSQHEINLECTDPLWAGDRTVLFTHATQKVAAEHGFHATFMPKPFDGWNRNAFHIHISMLDGDANNLFYDPGAEHGLSRTARQFIGGIIQFARETSIIMASTFNSYKAYVLEREAPIMRGWAMRNRSSMVRVPYANHADTTRIELRNPDPAGNVYLQLAILIAMGLYGVERGLDCGKPDVGSAYKKHREYRVWDKRCLPRCMFEALVEAERSKFLKDVLGTTLYDHYMCLKIREWEEHRTHVTPREHKQYLMI